MTQTTLALHAVVLGLVLTGTACGDASPAHEHDSGSDDAPTGLEPPCDDADFVDATALIQFGGEGGAPVFGYAPQCLRVAPGTVVSFAGDFSVHPLSPGLEPGVGADGSPIPRTSSGRGMDVAFPTAGTFPYFCEYHYAGGMRGAIRVGP